MRDKIRLTVQVVSKKDIPTLCRLMDKGEYQSIEVDVPSNLLKDFNDEVRFYERVKSRRDAHRLDDDTHHLPEPSLEI